MQFQMPVTIIGTTSYDINGKLYPGVFLMSPDTTNENLKGYTPAKMPVAQSVFDALPAELSAYPYECVLAVTNKVSKGKITQTGIALMKNESTAKKAG